MVYSFNNANQRVTATDADGKYWNYGYDALGQVTSGTKKLADGTPLLGHDMNYSFDTIGNRQTSTANGGVSTYTTNSTGLNQYQSRTVPAAFDVTGTADPAANVFINFLPADRQAELFHLQLTANNAAAPAWQPVTVVASRPGAGAGGTDGIQKKAGNIFVPMTPESYGYDFDGNLTSDGRWSYTWDAENRLTAMETQSAAVSAGVPRQKLEFKYDSVGRRMQKKVSNWNGTTYVIASDTRFAYDGWNLIAELNGLSGNAVIRTYVWGLDLSGSSQGAGGVGGLLAMNLANSSTYSPTYDGNGNIVSLINAADGTTSAEYAYGPFGEVIKAAGVAVTANPFGFSTKYQDAESGLLYYGFRYYNPNTGRWLNRDSLGEVGGNNLYGFIDNDGINTTDLLGLARNGSGHTYSTYLAVAYVLGNPDAGYSLAINASMPDSLKSRTAYAPGLPAIKAALNFISGGNLFPGFDRIQRYLHSLDGGDPIARRVCLTKMLGRDGLKPWQEGFLIHALGDAYFHVGADGKLYVAPFGHAGDSVDGRDPDQILFGDQRQTKLAPFLQNLTSALNRGPLDSAQQGRLDQLMGEIGALPGVVGKTNDVTGLAEDDAFRKLAISHGYGENGYRPQDALSTRKYLKTYGTNYALPSDAEVQEFLKLIKCNCSK